MFLEPCIINGFCYLNHTSEAQDSHKIKHHICSFKFQKETVTLQCGAGITRTLLYPDWQKECNDWLNRFYTSDGEFIEVITVPDSTGKVDESSLRNKIIYILKNWCNLSSNALGLVAANYNLVNSLLFHGVTEATLKETLKINNFPPDSERIIVYNALKNIIFVVRLISDDINEILAHCISDVKLLTLLLKDELHESGTKIAGLMVYNSNDKIKHCVEKCTHCNICIVTPEIFQSEEFFENFWIKYTERRKFNEIEPELPTSNKVDTFSAVASKILGHMARHKTNTLPTVIQNDPVKAILEAEMLLDRYQMEIAYAQQKRIILKGEYGSGKTVIALKKMQLLLETLKDKEAIYYINFNGRSELHGIIKQKLETFCKSNKNIKVIGGSHNLSYIIKSQILTAEDKIGVDKINLIVDEYASENLTKSEANTLHKTFEKVKQFRNSTILIATQPIEIDRQVIFNDSHKLYYEKGHMFEQLKTFKVYNLKYVMRTTVQINALAKVTQDYLNSKSNLYIQHQTKQKGSRGDTHYQNIYEELPCPCLKTRNPSKMKQVLSKLPTPMKNVFSKMKRNTYKIKNISNSLRPPTFYVASPPSSCISQTAASDRVQLHDIVDSDELQKLTFSRDKQNTEKNQRIITTYHYPCESKIGHGIHGPLPQVIYLSPSISQIEQVVLMGMFFKNSFEKLQLKRIVIAHFEPSDSFWLKWLLLKLSLYTSLKVTNDVKEFLEERCNNIVLVKNYTFLKGLEFPNVVLMLDANEYYLKQFIPEAMTRCQSYLCILIKRPEKNLGNDTVADLLNFWHTVNAEEKKPIINIIKIDFCSKTLCCIKVYHEKEFCNEAVSGNVINSYNMHKNCRLYEDLMKDIKFEGVLDMEPIEEVMQEKANAM